MEKVQKVCTAISEPSEYNGNYYYWITFDDGTSANFGCKTQDLFVVGQSSEFYIEEKVGKSGKPYKKVKRIEAVENSGQNFPSGGGKSYSKERSQDNEKFMCLSYAKDIFIAFNGKMPSPTDVTEYAEVLYSETKNPNSSKPFGVVTNPIQDGHQQALQQPKKEEPTDDLPF